MIDIKDVFRIIISFFLGIVLIFFQAVLFLDFILLNPISYYEYVNIPAYYEKLRDQIDFGLEEVGRFTNLPGDVITASVKDVEIKDFTQTAVSEMIAFLRGDINDYTLRYDTTAIKNNLESYTQNYAAQRNQPYTQELAKQVDEIAKMSGERIETYTMIIDPALLKQVGMDKKIQSVFSKMRFMEMTLAGLMLLLVFILWLMNKHHRMRTLWWTGSSLMVSSIVLLIPGITIELMNISERIGLTDNYITWVLERSIDSTIIKWNLMQLIFLAFGVLLMISYFMYRRRKILLQRNREAMKEVY
ncbi:hypothetical protein [Acetobacterium bakii]|uniref:DUF1461 domain-containing protein n=1 Tax=Acetobacterium bakii TaxID=52689 RepID=A0A0L6U3H9_9FIRM|nr:hypothetical protein [Acetobacterium bakii]KNZ42887.1 hypothetical protein AKG39_03970 [Acetobacterium bakii]